MHRQRVSLVAGTCLFAALASRGFAYVDLAPTIAKIITDSRNISVVKVVELNTATHTLVLEETKVLKGDKAAGPIRHQVSTDPTAVIPRAILQWAQPGAQAVLFASARTAIVCLGQAWYQVKRSGTEWQLGTDRPELSLAYYGAVPRLADGIEKMLAGRDAILTMMPHGVEQGASFDLALNRSAYPGLVRVQRLRANMKMPGVVFAASKNPVYMMGMGPADESDLPSLIEQLRAADPALRAQAADDIRQMTDILGINKTLSALPALEKNLTDPDLRTKTLAAGAILRLQPNHAAATAVLLASLHSGDAHERRLAATAAAVTTKGGAAALVAELARLAHDPDSFVAAAAIQAIGTLGPVALPARDALMQLLADPEFQIDAADALGRMGPRAQPVPPAMTQMLQSPDPAVIGAAIRGMSQIGGPTARPAAEYIAQNISTASETDAYNMVLYLALLGPVAKGPAATIKSLPFPNPALPLATNWAMNADTMLPWESGLTSSYGDVGSFIYSAYVTELGERLRPCALLLAPRLIDGTAGTIPDWGYRILNAAPDECVALIAPHLADKEKRMRERAAIILGYMGPPAHTAAAALQTALAASPDAQEKNLLGWAFREVTDK